MNLKNLGTALVASFALVGVMANSAFAVAVTEPAKWFVTGSELKGSQAVTSSLDTGTVAVLETEVGEWSLTINASGLECVGCTIFNEGGLARGNGKLKFTGVTVVTPTGCEVSGGAVETSALAVNANYMGVLEKEFATTVALANREGPTKPIATVTLKAKTGKTCAISGPYIVKGNLFVKWVWGTGVPFARNFIQSSPVINAVGGGGLTFGAKPATLTAEAFLEAGATDFDLQ